MMQNIAATNTLYKFCYNRQITLKGNEITYFNWRKYAYSPLIKLQWAGRTSPSKAVSYFVRETTSQKYESASSTIRSKLALREDINCVVKK